MRQNKNKILMIAATPFFSDRGCHIRIYSEAKYLQKNGFDVTLCTYHLGDEVPGIKTVRSVNVPWYKKTTPGASWHKLYIDLFLLWTTFRTYRKLRPGIIHAHLYEGLLIGWLVKTFTFSKTKLIFDCQGSLAEEMMAYTLHKSLLLKPFYYLFKLIERILLKLPEDIFCSSQNSYTFIKENYSVDLDRLHILEDAVDTELFEAADKNPLLRSVFGLGETDLVFVYSGSLSRAKGVHLLINALPEIFEKRADIKFLLIGYGDMEEEIRTRLVKYIDGKRLIMTGRLSYFDLPRYLKLADYAVEPKRDSSESSGKLLNYVAAGVAVVCFRNYFNKSVLGDDGHYIDEFLDLLDLGTKKEVVITGVNWAKNIEKLIQVYD